jgi:2,4-dienoyl-CoA reductase (NADPH2)
LHGFDDVILATGIVPRTPAIPGIDHAKVASYVEIVDGRRRAGARVALIGAGGIGFDVAELLSAANPEDGHVSEGAVNDPAIAAFVAEWGIDVEYAHRGGVMPPQDPPSARKLWLLQRKTEKVGAGLAKTTGWIRRTLLKKRGVTMTGGVEYERIDDAGLHVKIDGMRQLLDVDTIVVCAGQEPRRELRADLEAAGIAARLIGGADIALELDARRAIEQGTRVALEL